MFYVSLPIRRVLISDNIDNTIDMTNCLSKTRFSYHIMIV